MFYIPHIGWESEQDFACRKVIVIEQENGKEGFAHCVFFSLGSAQAELSLGLPVTSGPWYR